MHTRLRAYDTRIRVAMLENVCVCFASWKSLQTTRSTAKWYQEALAEMPGIGQIVDFYESVVDMKTSEDI